MIASPDFGTEPTQFKTLVLWCGFEGRAPAGFLNAYWCQYLPSGMNDSNEVSLAAIVNDDARNWKRKYLDWLDELSGSGRHPGNLSSRLVVERGLSYWWMTLPSEFTFSPSSLAYTCMRLWALTDLIETAGIEKLHSIDGDDRLNEVLEGWCSQAGVHFSKSCTSVSINTSFTPRSFLARIGSWLPPAASAVGHIAREYVRYFRFIRPGASSKTQSPLDLSVIDYFVNVDLPAAANGTYVSNYWGPLTKFLHESRRTISWVHIYVSDGNRSNLRKARLACTAMTNQYQTASHTLLQDYLTAKVALKAALLVLKVGRRRRFLTSRETWIHKSSGCDLSPLITPSWEFFTTGIGAARNCMWLALFDELECNSPARNLGIYLMENQPWELALVRAWKANDNGPLIGFVHSVAHASDLRYALGSQKGGENALDLPRPDRVAVIAPGSRAVMHDNGYPADQIVEVESLRFLGNSPKPVRPQSSQSLRILLVGEYDELLCKQQVRVLSQVAARLGDAVELTFRAHPARRIAQFDLDPHVKVSNVFSIKEDFAYSDAVLTTNSTSASLDAFLEGLPLAMFRDGRILSRSPLSDYATPIFVDSAEDIIRWIASLEPAQGELETPGGIINLNHDLRGWNKALSTPH